MVLELMQPGEIDAQAAQRQLERILASAGFHRNERLSRFLRFIVERHLSLRDRIAFALSAIAKSVKDDQCEWSFLWHRLQSIFPNKRHPD